MDEIDLTVARDFHDKHYEDDYHRLFKSSDYRIIPRFIYSNDKNADRYPLFYFSDKDLVEEPEILKEMICGKDLLEVIDPDLYMEKNNICLRCGKTAFFEHYTDYFGTLCRDCAEDIGSSQKFFDSLLDGAEIFLTGFRD